MVGSLRNTVTPDSIADELIEMWKSPAFNGKVLVLVEGGGDRTFYYKFFNKENAAIRDCKGCKKVVEVYKLLQNKAKFNNITIKDSDFDRLNGKPELGINFFYSDCHDYEMMCMKNVTTVKKLFANLAVEYDEDIINRVFEDLKYLSFFKWYNYTFHTNYNFRKFSVTDKTVEQLNDFDYIHNCLMVVSTNCNKIEKKTLEDFIESKSQSQYDLYEMTNGHDFIKRMIHHIKKKYNTLTNINEEKLKNTLHPCYDIRDFKLTNLYKGIQQWESNNNINITNTED